MKLAKKILAMTLVLSCVGINTISAYAADGGSLNSNATITFTSSTDPTVPQDPENPGTTVTPTPPVTGTAGPLSIDFASSFDFGTQKISTANQTYTALAQTVTLSDGVTTAQRPNFVQVTDNRGTETGWTLAIKQNSDFTSTSVPAHTLPGALITIKNISVASISASAKPTAPATLALNNADQVIMGATNGQGAGTYIAKFGDNTSAATSVELLVPGNITKYAETYTTTLTWTLTDTPAN